MFLNFVALTLHLIAAIYQGINGNTSWCLLCTGFVLLNLPFTIKWLIGFFSKHSDG